MREKKTKWMNKWRVKKKWNGNLSKWKWNDEHIYIYIIKTKMKLGQGGNKSIKSLIEKKKEKIENPKLKNQKKDGKEEDTKISLKWRGKKEIKCIK